MISMVSMSDIRSKRLCLGRLVDRWLAADLDDLVVNSLEDNLQLASNIGKLMDGETRVTL